MIDIRADGCLVRVAGVVGYQHENYRAQIRFPLDDVLDIVTENPGGSYAVVYKRMFDEQFFTSTDYELDGAYLVWNVSSHVVAVRGDLEVQIVYSTDQQIAETQIYHFKVARGLMEDEEGQGENLSDLIEQALLAAGTVDQAIYDAQQTLDEKVTAAQTAQTAAEAAQTAAERAQHTAENAKTSAAQSANAAYNFAADANTAKRDSVNAKNDAVQAKGDAELAKTAAETAKDSANTSALKSEGYAVGTQNGTPAGSGEPYYQDNAKYYKEQAAAAKTAAEAARDTAQQTVAGIEAAGTAQVQRVTAEGATQVGNVQTKGQQVLDSIPDDYSELSDNVTDLKRTIALVNTEKIFLESGTFTDATGTVKTDNVNRARNVSPIPVENIVSIETPTGYDMYTFLLDNEMNKTGTLYWSTYREKSDFGSASYINISIRKTSAPSTSIASEIDAIESGIKYVTWEKEIDTDNSNQNEAIKKNLGIRLVPDKISSGVLHYDGTASFDSGFKLLKYSVTPGELVFLNASVDNSADWEGVYQWQDDYNVPSSNNTHVIGKTSKVAVNAFVTVPSGATWLIVCASVANNMSGVYSVNTQEQIDRIEYGIRKGLTVCTPDAVATGWKLKNSGLSSQDSNFKLIKYAVNAGDVVYLKATKDEDTTTAGVWQWQNNASVPGSVNNYLVGLPRDEPFDGFITVPDGATYLIISSLKTNTASGLYVPGINENTQDIVSKYINNNTLYDRKSVQKNSDKNFVFFSDIHAGAMNYSRIIEFCNHLGSGTVDAIINGGDTVQSVLSESVEWYDNATAETDIDVLTCVGNHDVWSSFYVTGDPVTIYNKFTKPVVDNVSGIVQPSGAASNGLNYYYKDYGNIRIIVLAAMYYTESDQLLWTQEQKTWLESVLADAATNSKAVICVSHAPYMKSKAVIDEDIPLNSWRNYINNSIFDGICVAQEAVNAVHGFIENGGEFVCWLTGHTHQDMIMTEQDYGDQFLITIASAKYVYHSDGFSPAETELNATGFDCFDYIGIDTTNKMIKVWRIGYNEDASMRIRNRWAYDYANKKILSYS